MKYSSEFKCLKDKCPNNCCTNTEIKLSVIDLLRLKSIGSLSFDNGKYVFEKGSVSIFFDTRKGWPYGVMDNKNNACPFLEKGLCSIYEEQISPLSKTGKVLSGKGLSLRAVPLICRSYPFMIFYPETGDIGLNSGCKGVPSQRWEYVVRDDLMNEVLHEVSIYRRLMNNIDLNANHIIKLMKKNKFLRYCLRTLEGLSTANLEEATFK